MILAVPIGVILDTTTILENQTEKSMENEMETVVIMGYIGVCLIQGVDAPMDHAS